MKARIKRIEGLTFAAKGDTGHWHIADTSSRNGGNEGAATPMEMVLFSLATCTGMDVLSILKKMRVDLKDFEILVDAERAEEHPKVYTDIHLTYRFFGDAVEKEKAEKAVELSQERYCSVSAMLRHSVNITSSVEIHSA